MSSFSVQFYATLDEICAFARGWLGNKNIYAVAVEYSPFKLSPTVRDDVEAHLRRDRVQRLVLAEEPFDCSVQGDIELVEKNEGVLIVDIGRAGPSGLLESVRG
jgi:hypothetical protein